MSRKNSKERAVSFDNKDSRSYSISSYGSIETIDLEENEKEKINLKPQRRRKRENNVEEYKRRNTVFTLMLTTKYGRLTTNYCFTEILHKDLSDRTPGGVFYQVKK